MLADLLPRGISVETAPFLLTGLGHTLGLAVICIAASLVLGLVFGIMRYSGGRTLR